MKHPRNDINVDIDDIDINIDAVLDRLRTAEAPPGMERRILDAVHGRALAPSRPVWHRALSTHVAAHRITRRLALGLTASAMLAVALALPAIYRHRQTPAIARQTAALVSAPPPPASDIPAPADPAPQSAATPLRKQASRRRLSPPQTPSPSARCSPPACPPHPSRSPPQEKLLLRVARKGDPEPKTILNADLRAKQEAQQEADFDKFFGKLKEPQAAENE